MQKLLLACSMLSEATPDHISCKIKIAHIARNHTSDLIKKVIYKLQVLILFSVKSYQYHSLPRKCQYNNLLFNIILLIILLLGIKISTYIQLKLVASELHIVIINKNNTYIELFTRLQFRPI